MTTTTTSDTTSQTAVRRDADRSGSDVADFPPAPLCLTAVPLSHPALARIRHWDDMEQVHKGVMSLFADRLPGDARERRASAGILFRIDTQHGRVLVQSAVAPLSTDCGILTRQMPMPMLTAGRRVRFRTDINAVRCQSRTGRRLPVPDGELAAWLEGKLSPALRGLVVHRQEVAVLRTGKVPLRVAQVDGLATVAEPALLSELVRCGTGRARAYGCGLLSVVPVG